MTSHVIRALRWRMLLTGMGYPVRSAHSFLSLMVGYLVNLAIPRGGELSRCYNLYKITRTPVDVAFGTVVVERVIDLICLAVLLAAAFLLEAGNLNAFLESLPWLTIREHGYSMATLLLIITMVFAIAAGFLYFRSKRIRSWVLAIWQGILKGILSVRELRQRKLFLFYSVAIWLLYFLMSYTVIQAFDATHHLGLSAVISLFAIGSVAMAIPLPGGTGSYHVLVPQGLVMLYAIPRAQAVAFTFIFHGWQTVIMIVAGVLALVATFFITKKVQGD
jgi:hypothetical protein